MNRDQLLEVLDQFKVPVFQRDVSNGGTVIVAQRGARILGMFPTRKGTCPSALWISPNIEAILSGQATDWAGDAEGGLGGDRLWVSPERDFYYEDPKTFGRWFCPLEMDPGSYRVIGTDIDKATYENRFDLKDRARDLTFTGVTMRRCVRALENPVADLPLGTQVWQSTGYVGVETVDEIEIPSPQPAAPMLCPWGLTQVPAAEGMGAGTVVVPTREGARPVHYFGPVPPERLRVEADHVAFKIDALSITKIGIPAEDLRPDSPGRIACIAPAQSDSGHSGKTKAQTGQWVAIVRESSAVARAGADALDPAKSDPDGPRGVVQSYCNGPNGRSEWARFGEVEMQHLPLRQDASGAWKSRAVSRIMVFEGSRQNVLSIACHALGIDAIDLFE